MNRLLDWDDDSVTVAIIPQTCAACAERTESVRLSLEPVISSSGDFVGIRTVAHTPCCGGKRSAPYPAEQLARLLDHLKFCPNHSEKP